MLDKSKPEQLEKITLNLPTSVLKLLDSLSTEQPSDRSARLERLICEMVQERFETEMREGYLANAEEDRQIAEELFPLAFENWPEVDHMRVDKVLKARLGFRQF